MNGLEKLRVDAYRSLRDVQLEQFGRMNLIVGSNNAGKTSVLEAIGLAARPMDQSQWVQTAMNRDASGPLVDGLWALFPGSTVLKLEGGAEESRGMISIHANFGGRERLMKAEATAVVEQWTDIERAGAVPRNEVAVRITPEVQDRNLSHSTVLEFSSAPHRTSAGAGLISIHVFTITPATHRSTALLITHLSQAIDEGAKTKSVELLKMFDPDVTDVLISRPFGRDAIRVDHAKRGIVDLSSFGDGMRRAFAMSIALSRARGGILLIDEIESAIHARALDGVLPWLMRAAEEADVQIIATTHSLEAIDSVIGAFTGAAPETMITYHLRRTDTGDHVCHRYDLAGLRGLRDEGLDIR